MTIADISLDPEDSGCCDVKAGGAVGGFVNIGINDMASIQPEILYSMKGGKASGDETGQINLNFVEIPILVRANVKSGGRARPFVVAGPSVGFRTKAELQEGDRKEDFKDEVEKVDVGVIVGAGVAVGRATVEARYNLGLKNIAKDDSSKAKTRTFSVLVGIGIGR